MTDVEKLMKKRVTSTNLKLDVLSKDILTNKQDTVEKDTRIPFESEVICNVIFDKFISLTITESSRRVIGLLIPQYCYSLSKSHLNDLLDMEFALREKHYNQDLKPNIVNTSHYNFINKLHSDDIYFQTNKQGLISSREDTLNISYELNFK